jgi:hypothetical protein
MQILLLFLILVHLAMTKVVVDECRLRSIENQNNHHSIGFPRSPHRATSIGTLRIAVLFVEFSDSPAKKTNSFLERTLKFLDLEKTVAKFYRHVSYDKLELKFLIHRKWLRMSRPSAEYNMTGAISYEIHKHFLNESIYLGIESGAAWNLTRAECLLVVTNPDCESIRYGPAFVTSSEWGIRVPALNKTFHNAVSSGRDSLEWREMWYVHELAHNLGLVDLYKNGKLFNASFFSEII